MCYPLLFDCTQHPAMTICTHLLWSIVVQLFFKIHLMLKYMQCFLVTKSSAAVTGLRFSLHLHCWCVVLIYLSWPGTSWSSDPAVITPSSPFHFLVYIFWVTSLLSWLVLHAAPFIPCASRVVMRWEGLGWESGGGIKEMLEPALLLAGRGGWESSVSKSS